MIRWRLGVAETLTIAALVVGVIVWAVRLEGLVHAQQREIDDVKQQQVVTVQQFREDLAYIRSRIDAAIASGRQ